MNNKFVSFDEVMKRIEEALKVSSIVPAAAVPLTLDSGLLKMAPGEPKTVHLATQDPFWFIHLDASGFGNLKGVLLRSLWMGSQCVFGAEDIGGANASDWSMIEVKNFPLLGYFLNVGQQLRACVVNKGPEPVEFRLLVKGRTVR